MPQATGLALECSSWGLHRHANSDQQEAQPHWYPLPERRTIVVGVSLRTFSQSLGHLGAVARHLMPRRDLGSPAKKARRKPAKCSLVGYLDRTVGLPSLAEHWSGQKCSAAKDPLL